MVQSTLPSPLRQLARWIFWVVLPLLAGLLLSLVLVPVPQVGVIRFQDVIWYESNRSMSDMLDYVSAHPRIRAVVLQIDSPGGEVTPTEDIFFQLLQLRQRIPLVVAIDGLAASGGYYMAAAGDYVFAKPSSTVGNIGVITMLPSIEDQRITDEDVVATGPFKFSGGSRGDFMRQLELLKLSFLQAVFTQRGERLKADREMLSSGEVFLGLQARQLGLVDELGAVSEAVQKAAKMARIAHYQVIDVAEVVFQEPQPEEPVIQVDWGQKIGQIGLPQGLYYLYIEPEQRRP